MPDPGVEPCQVTELVLAAPLRMIDFGAIGLRRLGLDRGDVIDCDSVHYPKTQALGAWAYAATAATGPGETVHGIVWTSRQDDAGQAAIFFGDRLSPDALTARNAGQSLHAGHVSTALMRLADRLGLSVIGA